MGKEIVGELGGGEYLTAEMGRRGKMGRGKRKGDKGAECFVLLMFYTSITPHSSHTKWLGGGGTPLIGCGGGDTFRSGM